MDIQQLFSALQSDDGLKSQFTDALAAGKEILEKFLKDHDVNAAVEDVMGYIKENAASLSGIIPTDLLGKLDLGNVTEAVSGIASNVAGGLGDEAGEVVGKVAGAVTDAFSDGDPSDVVEKVTEAVAGNDAATGILGKIKNFFAGK